MYRPPENCNRVKSIKSKFENVQDRKVNLQNESNMYAKKDNCNDKTFLPNLSRQLSDPSRKNVKRTPAFRIDNNSEKVNIFERNGVCNRSFYFERLQQYNSAHKNNENGIKSNKVNDEQNKVTHTEVIMKENSMKKPTFMKSKSSLDFASIRNKFEDNLQEKPVTTRNEINKKNDNLNVDLFCLYAKPKPKILQTEFVKQNAKEKIVNSEICSDHAEKVPIVEQKNSDIVNSDSSLSTSFTDTLQAALKKPLPNGPAPQKPPRTFEHTQLANNNKNISFLYPNRRKQDGKIGAKTEYKHDPRYMLNKLENALRNNRIKIKHTKTETSTTSGEDSDDSVLYKSKTHHQLPSLPIASCNTQNAFNFNCFNGLTICKSTYETIKEPNSSFFVSCRPEPVYAEPFSCPKHTSEDEAIENLKNDQKSGRSLYYMSTSLLCDEENISCFNMSENFIQQLSTETSSVSSVSSESEAVLAESLPIKDNHIPVNGIKHLINTFEKRKTSTTSKQEDIGFTASDGSSRVEELKLSLQQTLERCFDDDSTNISRERKFKEPKTPDDKIINKFQTYVKTMPKYQRPQLEKDNKLFYCCLIVGCNTNEPKIKFRYPPKVKTPDRIEELCYPEVTGGPLDISNNAQCYSLVITNDRGERTFGYCRRVIPEGSSRCIPLAYCLLSKHRAPRFYKKILKELETRHGIPDKLRDELMNRFYHNKFPRPGESVKIDLTDLVDHFPISKNELHSRNRTEMDIDVTGFIHVNMNGYEAETSNMENTRSLELTLTLHHDTRYEEADLKPLHRLPSDILLKIFASLLLERKVILISCEISKLSSCVESLQSILYPFSWPHTFIPILPQCLWEVVESPTPLICGILSVAVVNDHKIEHGIVIDLDEQNIISEEGDEENILSDSMKKAWNEGVTLANIIPPDDYVHSVYLSDAYVKVFIVSLKHYKNHIVNNKFEKEAFIRNAKTRGIRRFLKWFTETTMFTAFIDSVITNPQYFNLFDKKIEMYGSDESPLILTKLREWKKV